MIGMAAILAGCTLALGPLAMFNLYFMPYWINVMWLDFVTYLHHHGPEDEAKIPWYRGEVMPCLVMFLGFVCAAWYSVQCQKYAVFLRHWSNFF